MLFLEVIAKNLTRRKTRTLLTAAGLAAAVAATTTLAQRRLGLCRLGGRLLQVARRRYRRRSRGRRRTDHQQPDAALLARLSAVARNRRTRRQPDRNGLVWTAHAGRNSAARIGSGGLCRRQAQCRLRRRPQEERSPTRVLLGSGLARALEDEGRAVGRDRKDAVPHRRHLSRPTTCSSPTRPAAPLADVQELMDRPGQVSEFQLRVVPAADNGPAIGRLCQQDRIASR